MDEQVIRTKRGRFGKLQVTLPLSVKNSIMQSIEHSGLNRAEYLRIALMIGSTQLANGISKHSQSEIENSSVAQAEIGQSRAR